MNKSLYFNAIASLCLVALMHTIAIAQLAKPWTENPLFTNATSHIELSTSLSNNYNYNLNASLELRNPYVPIGIKAGGTYYNDTQVSETFTHQSVIQGSSYALPIYVFGLPHKILISDSNKRRGYYSRAAGRASRKRPKASPCLFSSKPLLPLTSLKVWITQLSTPFLLVPYRLSVATALPLKT